MAKKITVVVSQGQSANPAKRTLEEDLVAALLFEPQVEVTVVPHLYDLDPEGSGMLCLQGIAGDMIVLSWLYPRAAHWTLDRHGIKGQVGQTLLESDEEDDEEYDDEEAAAGEDESADDEPQPVGGRDLPNRKIYCLDLRSHADVEPYLEEIRRIASEASVATVELLGWINGSPQPQQMERYLNPTEGNVAHRAKPADSDGQSQGTSNGHAPATNGKRGEPIDVSDLNGAAAAEVRRIEEETRRRWYPVIDYSRCTNCLECLDFCLFGVYGVDGVETILVEQPDNCRKGCPACSRVCPENAIIFPQHKTPAIAGSPGEAAGAFKIDLSKLFGAPDALEQAVLERDTELVADGRDAVGMTVGVPKRQANRVDEEKDDLDGLMDELEELDL